MKDDDRILTAKLLAEALPVMIDRAVAVGPTLATAAYGMRTALAEAERVIDEAEGRGTPIATLRRLLLRLGS